MNIFRRILVPHDFSDAAAHAFRVAIALAREHRGRLTVLHVVTPYQPVTQLPEVSGWISSPSPASISFDSSPKPKRTRR